MEPTAGRIISVGGGKGGVGKSIIATNLAVAFAQLGRSVIVVDADLGSPNQHTLFAVDHPTKTLNGLFDHTLDKLVEAVVPTNVEGVSLVPGSAAQPGAANIAFQQKQKLLRHISALPADVVLVDVGAGTHFNSLDLFNVADLRVVVMTPQLTAVQNAYAFLKGAVHRAMRQLAQGEEQLGLIESDGQARDTARLRGLLTQVRAKDPGFERALQTLLASLGVSLLGNQMLDASDANVPHALSRMVADFLSIDAPVLGCLGASRKLHDSVNRRRPYLLDAGQEPAARMIRDVARKLLDEDVDLVRRTRSLADTLCEAAYQPPETPSPLPQDLSKYTRRHPRSPVSMPVELVRDGVTLDGTMLQLSRGGALLETVHTLHLDSRWSLVFPAVEGRPSMEVTVRNLRAGHRLAGVEFVAPSALPGSLNGLLMREPANVAPPAPSLKLVKSG